MGKENGTAENTQPGGGPIMQDMSLRVGRCRFPTANPHNALLDPGTRQPTRVAKAWPKLGYFFWCYSLPTMFFFYDSRNGILTLKFRRGAGGVYGCFKESHLTRAVPGPKYVCICTYALPMHSC